jgi:hypothetical protein
MKVAGESNQVVKSRRRLNTYDRAWRVAHRPFSFASALATSARRKLVSRRRRTVDWSLDLLPPFEVVLFEGSIDSAPFLQLVRRALCRWLPPVRNYGSGTTVIFPKLTSAR